MKSRARKKLAWALSAVPAAFLLAGGAQIGGVHSPSGLICLTALFIVIVVGLVFGVQSMVAFANESKKEPIQPPVPTRGNGT
jgi:hypothetical protein